MPRNRNTVAKYNISKHRYLELYHYCMQYEEWKDTIKTLDGLKSHDTDGCTSSCRISSPVEDLAIKRIELNNKCRIIEETAEEADSVLKDYILAAVTHEGCTYKYLSTVKHMPCGHNVFYRARKRFYYLLSKKI